MNAFMHGPSFFPFHFFLFSISFLKLTIFTILRLYVACKMWKFTTALTWEISSWRLVEKFYISAVLMNYSPRNWIGEHEIIKLKKYICFESTKRTQMQARKHMNEMEWHKMAFLILSAMRMRKRYLFCTSSHHNVPYETQQEFNKEFEPWNECPRNSACAIVK